MLNATSVSDSLFERLRLGDPGAVDELFIAVYDRAVAITKGMLDGFPDFEDEHQAGSFVHLGYIDVRTALKTVRPRNLQEFLGLVIHKVRCILLDLAEKERRRRGLLAGNHDRFDAEGAASGPDPSTVVDRLEAWSRFHQAVGELPDHLRVVFELDFYTDPALKTSEIAKVVGVSVDVARRRLAKARALVAERVVDCESLFS